MWNQPGWGRQTSRASGEHRGSDESPVVVSNGREVAPLAEQRQSDGISKARMHWFFGEWSALEKIDPKTLHEHTQRDRLALLIAAAHAQLGSYEQARQHAHIALEWGCPPRLVAGDNTRTAHHFREAVAVTDSQHETDLLSHARSVREMTKLGLLPQAASLIGEQMQMMKAPSERPEDTQARIRMLETELELLHHELSLAQQRHQLVRRNAANVSGFDEPNGDSTWLQELKNRSVSQLGQDLWVLEKSGYKRGGFFVEFGATDGVLLSNTWLLEKEFGWRGICAEPNPKFFEQLKTNRSCITSDAVIGADTGNSVEFIFADVYGGFVEHAASDMHADKRAAYAKAGAKAMLKTISLDDFLSRYRAPHDIDYLSIDTEGSEFEILKAFPFEKWDVRLITVEHNFSDKRGAIRALLEGKGYQCTEREFDDWYEKS
jgi:FkbM family methyltransferase